MSSSKDAGIIQAQPLRQVLGYHPHLDKYYDLGASILIQKPSQLILQCLQFFVWNIVLLSKFWQIAYEKTLRYE